MVRLAARLFAVLIFLTALPALAQTVDQVRDRGLAWLISNQKGDGSWGTKPETFVANTALALQAFQAAGLKPTSYPYAAASTWLLNVNPASVDSLARQISALAATGANVAGRLAALERALNIYPAWGSYAGFDTSYPDTPLALSAYRAAGVSFFLLRETVYCEIVLAQLGNGGWTYFNSTSLTPSPGSLATAAIVPTAYNVVELKMVNSSLGWDVDTCPKPGAPSASVLSAINGGKAFLLTKKNTDGGFGPGGTSTVLDTAVAYLALRTLNPADGDAAAALNYLLQRQDTSATGAKGSWGGDPFQTALVMSVLPMPTTPLADSDQDGIPDGVEVLLGRNPSVNDSRTLAVGGGITFAGMSVGSQFSATALQLVPFNRILTATGGLPPYQWQLASGSLPPGLTLGASSGAITGTPSAAGSYSFTIAVRDTSGVTLNVPGTITVQPGNILPALLLILFDD